MVKLRLVTSLNLCDLENYFCEACALGKLHKISFKTKEGDAKFCTGERIFSDLYGPMKVSSVSGKRYYICEPKV